MNLPGSHLILLTGAPDASSLQWETGLLNTQLLPAFLDHDSSKETQTEVTKDQPPPAWRYIPMMSKHLPTGLSQIGIRRSKDYVDSAPRHVETSFFSTASFSVGSTTALIDDSVDFTSSAETDEEVLSQFYEQSFVIHENTASSQIQLQKVAQIVADDPTAAITSTSFLTSTCASDSFASSVLMVHERTPVIASGRINDLREIPDSSYLRSIVPQTMTVNLVVGIISISTPRSITTRREGRQMRLIEMLVGDETKAGFSINFWLPSLQQGRERSQKGEHLEDVLGTLRRQDVVLIQNVALNAFMGKVYGQSLRKDMTKLDLLHRNLGDDGNGIRAHKARSSLEEHDVHPQTAKMTRVQQWVMTFVGSMARSKSAVITGERVQGKREMEGQQDILPPDTQ